MTHLAPPYSRASQPVLLDVHSSGRNWNSLSTPDQEKIRLSLALLTAGPIRRHALQPYQSTLVLWLYPPSASRLLLGSHLMMMNHWCLASSVGSAGNVR